MKSLFYTLIALLLCLDASAQIKNAGFENWHMDSVWVQYNVADDWNAIGCSGCTFNYGAGQSSDAYMGTSAAFIRTDLCGFAGLPTPSIMVNGLFDPTMYMFDPQELGDPINYRPHSLSGYYKTEASNQLADSADDAKAVVALYLYRQNVLIGSDTTELDAVAQYTYFECFPTYWHPSATPDTFVVAITSNSQATLSRGKMQQVYIDELMFDRVGNPVEEDLEAKLGLQIWQQSDALSLHYKLENSARKLNIRMLASDGRLVMEERLMMPMLEGNLEWNTSHLPAGVYVCELTADGKTVATEKVVLW